MINDNEFPEINEFLICKKKIVGSGNNEIFTIGKKYKVIGKTTTYDLGREVITYLISYLTCVQSCGHAYVNNEYLVFAQNPNFSPDDKYLYDYFSKINDHREQLINKILY